jgi:hypothetical protein
MFLSHRFAEGSDTFRAADWELYGDAVGKDVEFLACAYLLEHFQQMDNTIDIEQRNLRGGPLR